MRNPRCAILIVALCLLGACAHPHRVPRRELARLVKSGEKFTLVFGSLKTLEGAQDVSKRGAGIVRFLHQEGASQSILRELRILSGDRFFAILAAPPAAKYLDHFDTEVRWAERPYDKFTHIKLQESPPFAMYVGEIEMHLAEPGDSRAPSPTQMMTVSVRDDFEAAHKELQRLYPRFAGEIRKSPLLRARAAAAARR